MLRRLLFVYGTNAQHRNTHTRPFVNKMPILPNEAAIDPLSNAVESLDLNKFKEHLENCRLNNMHPASQCINDRPLLIDICTKILETYQNEPSAFKIYKGMLLALQADLLPEYYQQHFKGETALTLLVQVDELSIAWHLNKILSCRELQDQNSIAPGIDGTKNRTSEIYGKDILLIRAVQAGSILGAEVLLNHGAKADIRDLRHKTAMDYAQNQNNPKLVSLLEKFCDPRSPKWVYTY